VRTRFDIAAVTPAAFMRGEPEPAAGDNDASWLLKFYETFKVRSLCRIIASCLTYTVSHIVSRRSVRIICAPGACCLRLSGSVCIAVLLQMHVAKHCFLIIGWCSPARFMTFMR